MSLEYLPHIVTSLFSPTPVTRYGSASVNKLKKNTNQIMYQFYWCHRFFKLSVNLNIESIYKRFSLNFIFIVLVL